MHLLENEVGRWPPPAQAAKLLLLLPWPFRQPLQCPDEARPDCRKSPELRSGECMTRSLDWTSWIEISIWAKWFAAEFFCSCSTIRIQYYWMLLEPEQGFSTSWTGGSRMFIQQKRSSLAEVKIHFSDCKLRDAQSWLQIWNDQHLKLCNYVFLSTMKLGFPAASYAR